MAFTTSSGRPRRGARRRPGPPARAAALLLALAACGGEEPPSYTLREVMFQQEFALRGAEAAAQEPGGAGEAAKALADLERWGANAAFESWLERKGGAVDAADFRRLHGENLRKIAAARAAAEAGDAPGLVGAVRAVRFSCELCHVRWRPGLR